MKRSGMLICRTLLLLLLIAATQSLTALTVAAQSVSAVRFDEADQMFLEGRYEQAAQAAEDQVQRGVWNDRWPRLLMQCQLATGQYRPAVVTYTQAIKRYPTNLTLRMLGIEAYQMDGQAEQAAEAEQQFVRLLQSSPSRFAGIESVIATGRYFVQQGEDARQILELFYDRARDADPTFLETYIATAELALAKGDFKVAADTLQQASSLNESDPRIPYLQFQAYAPSDSAEARAFLTEALSRNPHHVPSLLGLANLQIDSEDYSLARKTITKVLNVNPHQPAAWAMLAVLAHLEAKFEIEKLMRAAALSTWHNNPEVDHLIGNKLSQKYRFEEGAAYQRRALQIDSNYDPARFQLAQDLLRLGNEQEGWQLAQDVSHQDPYNVVAHNLMTLNERIGGFTRIESHGIEIRMDAVEARGYGTAVMSLLREAKDVLCEKYQIEPRAPVVVEIFPEQKDFAIRTFGLPGGAGYLGVCFGRVITANSPASQGERPANWQSVLWHEFCHAVTLEKTRNRMPRWLSEGISVYEERQRDPSWGESITPTYRRMILGDELTPVSQLSGAFLNPPSPVHLQFAYYESSLVVQFLVERYSMDALLKTLDDLAAGISINDALNRSVGSIAKLDAQFAQYARQRAEAFAPDADWDSESMPKQLSPKELEQWAQQHPNHYQGLLNLAQVHVAGGNYTAATEVLEKLVELGAITGGRGGVLEMLASAQRELKQSDAEKETLQRIVSLSSDALPALTRLMELARAENDHAKLLRYGDQFLAIQPMLPTGHTAVIDAAEALDQPQRAAESLQALAQMDPIDPALVQFRWARALAQMDRAEDAKRHVLAALDEAPRYRQAHRLLLDLIEPNSEEDAEP